MGTKKQIAYTLEWLSYKPIDMIFKNTTTTKHFVHVGTGASSGASRGYIRSPVW